jgi:hypothetical protein
LNAGGGEGHWLDRLAVAHTRRHAFKATLAAAALTFPLLRASRASAAEDSCTKGCIYAAQREHAADLNVCNSKPIVTPLYATYLAGFAALPSLIYHEAAILLCADTAHQRTRLRHEQCGRAGCPGFDPAGEYGPCRNCASINGCQCCPDSSSSTGYTYCSSLSNSCCNPGGGCRTCGT